MLIVSWIVDHRSHQWRRHTFGSSEPASNVPAVGEVPAVLLEAMALLRDEKGYVTVAVDEYGGGSGRFCRIVGLVLGRARTDESGRNVTSV